MLTDKVTATADYTTTKGSGGGDKLHVTASSSDSSVAGSALTLPDYGNKALDATGQADISTPAPPATVTVKSSKGGSVTVPVDVGGQTLDPLAAHRQRRSRPDGRPGREGDPRRQRLGRRHRLASAGAAPPASRSTGATTTKATFTAPTSATSLTFTLTVKSGTETKTDDVTVKVNPANPARAQIAPVGATVLQNLPLTLDGSTSIGAAKYEWSQVAGDGTHRLPGRGHDQLQADVPVPEDHDADPHPAARPLRH